MSTALIDILFDALALMFWMRIWTGDSRDLFFNPYMARISRITDAILDPVHKAAPFIPHVVVSLIACSAVVLLRSVVICFISRELEVDWLLRFGFIGAVADTSLILDCLELSAYKFVVFMFGASTIGTIYACDRGASRHAAVLMFHAGRPLTGLPVYIRPLVLIVAGIALSFLLVFRITHTLPVVAGDQQAWFALKMLISVLAAIAYILPVIGSALVVFVIGSWIATFSGSYPLTATCRDWTDFLLGAIRGLSFRIGMIDLTPLLVIIALRWITPPVMEMLLKAYKSVPLEM